MAGHSDPPGDMLAARNAINDVLNEFCIITRAALFTARVQDASYDSFPSPKAADEQSDGNRG